MGLDKASARLPDRHEGLDGAYGTVYRGAGTWSVLAGPGAASMRLWKFLLPREDPTKRDIVLDELLAAQTISHENYGTDHLALVVHSCATQPDESWDPGNDEVSHAHATAGRSSRRHIRDQSSFSLPMMRAGL
ncbi:MAG: hypothetical protein CVU63_15310 [Deltaproteobacteria bacterium HGW-Deltaproteobacteria-20]|nr:MAG: hypothetical protein CVU63_15310 [Deltaproteobacteria bacterium HGW-Deltaproteobacteria-20]